ncbi:aminoglycoside adenylyltransferase domain-containing protein [Ornithinibacillus sp. FSL M8-0202]|uniref:aminoglycoside adenylyltransferase domain-containing protein n=1 Tax=Ornithinibacillus sp. FSL M8-0202 TaxID=2921616 RepID=UPI0030CDDB11
MSTLPPIVETVLNEYISLYKKHLPNTLDGLYIHGSIALDAYVENSSDIDFITITSRRLTKNDAQALSFIHTQLANTYKKPDMDGVYIIREDVGKLDHNSKILYPYFNEGKLAFGDYFNFNPITWWLFNTKAINIVGPEPNTFHNEIHSHQLVSYVLDNMNSYWVNRIQSYEKSIKEISSLPTDLIDDEVEWTVLGLLRQFYTLKEHDIISKLDAGEYGLQHIPKEWHDIIKHAIHIRQHNRLEDFASNEERIKSVIGFSTYLINRCNNTLAL